MLGNINVQDFWKPDEHGSFFRISNGCKLPMDEIDLIGSNVWFWTAIRDQKLSRRSIVLNHKLRDQKISNVLVGYEPLIFQERVITKDFWEEAHNMNNISKLSILNFLVCQFLEYFQLVMPRKYLDHDFEYGFILRSFFFKLILIWILQIWFKIYPS